MTPQQALSAARVFQNPDRLLVETHPGVFWKEEGTWQRLQSSGHRVEAVKSPGQFGRVHMLLRKDGAWIGAADPDWSGTAMGTR
jgi:gamma-glutamyltranspeptidase